MIKIIIIIAVLYLVFVILYLSYLRMTSKKGKGIIASLLPQKPLPREEIMGKSKFVLRHSLPQAATPQEYEKEIENPTTFVKPEIPEVPEHPAKVPEEKLDEAFSDTPSDEEQNQPLDIDYPLTYEESTVEADSGEEESEDLPDTSILASGVSFDQMGEAFRSVRHPEKLKTKKKKLETGRVLTHLKHTDMFEAVVSGSPERQDIVSSVLEAYRTDFNKKQAAKKGKRKATSVSTPPDFDIRNLV